MKNCVIIVWLFLCHSSCQIEPSPRNESLPEYLILLDHKFGNEFEDKNFIEEISAYNSQAYENYNGNPVKYPWGPPVLGSYLNYQTAYTDSGNYGELEYHLSTSSTRPFYNCGLRISFKPGMLLRKDWSAIGFELRTADGIDSVSHINLGGGVVSGRTARYPMDKAFNITNQWCVYVSHFEQGNDPIPDDSNFIHEATVKFWSHATKPLHGKLQLRRLFILKDKCVRPAEVTDQKYIIRKDGSLMDIVKAFTGDYPGYIENCD